MTTPIDDIATARRIRDRILRAMREDGERPKPPEGMKDISSTLVESADAIEGGMDFDEHGNRIKPKA